MIYVNERRSLNKDQAPKTEKPVELSNGNRIGTALIAEKIEAHVQAPEPEAEPEHKRQGRRKKSAEA